MALKLILIEPNPEFQHHLCARFFLIRYINLKYNGLPVYLVFAHCRTGHKIYENGEKMMKFCIDLESYQCNCRQVYYKSVAWKYKIKIIDCATYVVVAFSMSSGMLAVRYCSNVWIERFFPLLASLAGPNYSSFGCSSFLLFGFLCKNKIFAPCLVF